MSHSAAIRRRDFLLRMRYVAGGVGSPYLRGMRRVSRAMLGWTLHNPATAFLGGLAVLLGALLPVWCALTLLPELATLRPPGVVTLEQRFAERGYDLAAVTDSDSAVPRLFLKTLPKDWRLLRETERRKALFLLAALPLVLRENERILAERQRLLDLRERLSDGGWMSPREGVWMQRVAEKYGSAGAELAELLRRVDAVPVSLALAQAAVESGWGTSRFAAEGNALFGQWTEDGEHAITPQERDPEHTHGIRRFPTLAGSVAAYMANLNKHAAYREFRRRRAELRRLGRRPTGPALVPALAAYSQRGADYIAVLRQVMAKNDLARFDSARLTAPQDMARLPDGG